MTRTGDGASAERAGADAIPLRHVASPYSTGGGGVTFERRVAAGYLALMLLGETALELGDDRAILSVEFQQAARVPVDDLVIVAGRPDETEASLELALGVRRRPNIVPSDEKTRKLIVEFVRALLRAPIDGREHRLALVVSGPDDHTEEVAELAALAANQKDAPSFVVAIESGGHRRQLRDRLGHVEKLVAHALQVLGAGGDGDTLVRQRTWELLRNLTVLMPRVEPPDGRDWATVQNRLVSVARGGDLAGAGRLLDRLETLAAEFGPSGATVDRAMLQRRVHALLELRRWRHQTGWAIVDHLGEQARAAVDHQIGRGGDDATLHLDRSAAEGSVITAALGASALVVHGESGVGKSALVLGGVDAAVATDPYEFEVVVLNLRHLPETSLELISSLGCSLEALLSELTPPQRLLVIDAADAAIESKRDVFIYLVDAARKSDVRVVAITAKDGRQVIHDSVIAQLDEDAVAEFEVQGLSEAEVDEVAARFPQLARLSANARSRELLRRLVVVDLLVRSGVTGLPLSDVEAMRGIWAGLIRNHERCDRGLPDARQEVLWCLADRELTGKPAIELVGRLDASAVDGLRRDGLLRTSTENPWQLIPEFAHDELRRYAVARALLADGDPAARLIAAGAPRWALAAARLACQALLTPADGATVATGRFDAVQAAFDTVVAAGHGGRWADAPGEALLTLGDPAPVLADAWPQLRAEAGDGLKRLLRLVNQHHRDATTGIVDPLVVEPVVALLLDEPRPWAISDDVERTLRGWPQALVVANVPAGHPLRIRLRDRLVAVCVQGEQRLAAQLEAAARAADRQLQQDEDEDDRHAEDNDPDVPPPVLTRVGYPRRRRKQRPAIPRELTDETVLELLALLGPDLGDEGERLLRRAAQGAPWELAPAVEELFTGRALGAYGHGLLADLTEAYYLDDDSDDLGLLREEGIRHHRWRGPVGPLATWYRGPFVSLFQTDFRRGIAVLNRLLNHAARQRVRILAGLRDPWNRASDEALDAYTWDLQVTETPQRYVGDAHVWQWYRGTGVGPYPCMSALQALERVCDQFISAGIPLERLVPVLLEGCENLAMPGLVVGILVRHLERAGSLLDPFLAEPLIWELEFGRTVAESGGLAASSDGLVGPERRRWSLREVGSWLTVHADAERADQLRQIAGELIAAAERVDEQLAAEAVDTAATGPNVDVKYSIKVRNWASVLDRDRYRAYTEGGVTYVQSEPPEDVQAALQPGNEQLERGQKATQLIWRYFLAGRSGQEAPPPATAEELTADLAAAKDLLENPAPGSVFSLWDAAAAVAAAALEANIASGVSLPAEALEFAVTVVLGIAEKVRVADGLEFDESYFEQRGDRSAARALPLLLLPGAATLHGVIAVDDGMDAMARVMSAGRRVAQATANEIRLYLARGLDRVWAAPCSSDERCHHELAFDLAVESIRDCVLGGWDPAGQQRLVERLEEPVLDSLAAVADKSLLIARLDPGIRALGAGMVHETCVRAQSLQVLVALLEAQRRGLLAHKQDFDHRSSHALVAARAFLNLAAAEDDAPLEEHIAAFADRPRELGSLLGALAATAEETPDAAAAARRIWPNVIQQVLELNRAGHHPFGDDHYGEVAIAALMPTPTYESAFLYRELDGAPIAWTDALAWRTAIEAWLPEAAGRPRCADSMIGLLCSLPLDDQVDTGLPWVETLVQADVDAVARQSYRIADWLRDIRATAADRNALIAWQRLVDALVVAGDSSLAPYSE